MILVRFLRLHRICHHSDLENGSFTVPFEPGNWLKIVDPDVFLQTSTEDQE